MPQFADRRAAERPDRDAGSDFAALVAGRPRGKLKLYIGSAAGTGKTYRMLNEAHDLRHRGIDVVVGFAETHGRTETEAQLRDLEVVPRRQVEYRGVMLEEMDLDAVLQRRPQVALVDELAHTNVPGSRNPKRWQDVLLLLDEGINVISAVNVQHLESLNDVIARQLGVTVRETVPDWVLGRAKQVVNLDVSAEDLRQRLEEGKIYRPDKIEAALANFFTHENLTTLRELALREVASSVDRIREEIVAREEGATRANPPTVDRVMVAMSSLPPSTAVLLRKASRIAGRLNSDWLCVYVQTPEESAARIGASVQRRLVENIQLAQRMGAEVVKVEGRDVADALCAAAVARGVTLLIVGQSRRSWMARLIHPSVIARLVRNTRGIDVLVVSLEDAGTPRMDAPKASARQVSSSRVAVPAAAGQEEPLARLPDVRPVELEAHVAKTLAAATRWLGQVRISLHILLENRFGDLNENQEELLGAARAAADEADAELRKLAPTGSSTSTFR